MRLAHTASSNSAAAPGEPDLLGLTTLPDSAHTVAPAGRRRMHMRLHITQSLCYQQDSKTCTQDQSMRPNSALAPANDAQVQAASRLGCHLDQASTVTEAGGNACACFSAVISQQELAAHAHKAASAPQVLA